MSEEKMSLTVLAVEPNKAPYVKNIEAGLSSLQHEVGGYIEAVYPFDDPVAIICDEEGKLNGKPLNRALYGDDGVPYDILSGKFLVVGLGEEDFCSLSDDYLKKYAAHFKDPEWFINTNGGMVVMKMPIEERVDAAGQGRPSLSEQIDKAKNKVAPSPSPNEMQKEPETER